MRTANSHHSAFDPALLDAIAQHGYVFIVEHTDEAALLRSMEYPSLDVPDVTCLTAPVLTGISEITVFQQPGFGGTLYGNRVERQLEAVGWRGQLILTPYPDEAPSLQDLYSQFPDRQELGIQLLSLANNGIVKQLGKGPPRSQAASKLAGKIAAAWQETLVFDMRRRCWMAYGATHPGIWGELAEVEMYDRVRRALTPPLAKRILVELPPGRRAPVAHLAQGRVARALAGLAAVPERGAASAGPHHACPHAGARLHLVLALPLQCVRNVPHH
jgi:hypothetical protein